MFKRWMRLSGFQQGQIIMNCIGIITMVGFICAFPFILIDSADKFAKESIRLEEQERQENMHFMKQCMAHEPEYICAMKLKEWRK